MNQLLFSPIILLFLQLLSNLHPPASHHLQDDVIFNKLVGTWLRTNGKYLEKWEKKADGSFFSVSFRISGTDTTLEEEVVITRQGQGWEYAVKGAGKPDIVRFKTLETSSSRVHFSNPSHDFPTDIVYELISRNSLRAYIVGKNDKGGKDTVWFNFKRLHP